VTSIAPSPAPFDLRTTFVALDDRGAAIELTVDADFWSKPDSGVDNGRLVSIIRSDGDWPNWEMHPQGDEVIYLLSGAMTLIVETGLGNQKISMTPDQAFIVPSGTWHTANVTVPGDALYITLGNGTLQRPRGSE
jgi:mannose-6-phosphate isomerase-like protein (cupin superfamily)